MNMILYSGEGISVRDSLRNMTYNYMRSHHYIILKLARALGCTKLLDGNPGITTEVVPGSDLYYSLKEFNEYHLESTTITDYADSIAVLFFSVVTKSNYNKILKSISSSPYFIYYNSDPEFNKNYQGPDADMFLKFIKDNPGDPLAKYFKSRCIAVITGFHFMIDQISVLGKPVIHIPQIINPNFPRFHSEKFYDVWMINTTPTHKQIADELVNEGISVFALTRNKEYCSNIDCIECKSAGLSLDILLSAVSLCKYYIGSYPALEASDKDMLKRYSTWNHTFKVFESYYANTYWLSSNKTLRQCIDVIKSEQWKNQRLFNKYLEDNYSFKNYESNFKSLVDICKECIV